jgi:hypothetical protein
MEIKAQAYIIDRRSQIWQVKARIVDSIKNMALPLDLEDRASRHYVIPRIRDLIKTAYNVDPLDELPTDAESGLWRTLIRDMHVDDWPANALYYEFKSSRMAPEMLLRAARMVYALAVHRVPYLRRIMIQ